MPPSLISFDSPRWIALLRNAMRSRGGGDEVLNPPNGKKSELAEPAGRACLLEV
ncbi:MAG: hypothetical protein ORO03_03370 [Alphaproteobacteria bacterium]|nr:hypothetical protein [Alphaproteobacteria bacterium]